MQPQSFENFRIEYPQSNLTFETLISIGLHIIVIGFFSIRAVFFATEPLIIQSAIRVDLVDLPEKIKPQQILKPAAPEKNVEIPKNPDDMTLNKDKEKDKKEERKKDEDRMRAALDKIKRMEALEKLKTEVETSQPQKPKEYKGNILSAGSDLTGLDQLQHDDYIARVVVHVKKFWTLPQWLANASLTTEVFLQIDETGNVLNKTIRKSSGNSQYDEWALLALTQASPLPAPPARFRNVFAVKGFVVAISP